MNDIIVYIFKDFLYQDKSIFQSLGIPCFLGGMSRGLLGKHSPIQVRQRRREALKDADLVILAGEPLLRFIDFHHHFGACVIVIGTGVMCT